LCSPGIVGVVVISEVDDTIQVGRWVELLDVSNACVALGVCFEASCMPHQTRQQAQRMRGQSQSATSMTFKRGVAALTSSECLWAGLGKQARTGNLGLLRLQVRHLQAGCVCALDKASNCKHACNRQLCTRKGG